MFLDSYCFITFANTYLFRICSITALLLSHQMLKLASVALSTHTTTPVCLLLALSAALNDLQHLLPVTDRLSSLLNPSEPPTLTQTRQSSAALCDVAGKSMGNLSFHNEKCSGRYLLQSNNTEDALLYFLYRSCRFVQPTI